MSRPVRVTVDTDALRHNYRLLRQAHGGRVLAVLKANAYGHGAVECAQALTEADGLAVGYGDEAAAMRAAGIRRPLLVLAGVFSVAELQTAVRESWWIVVHHEEQLAMIEHASFPPGGLNVWLKMDSGMHRCGFEPSAFVAAHARLKATGKVSDITLMTHFARADEPAISYTADQVACFDIAAAGLPGARSLANSAGVLAWPAARRDWARCGIALYGAGGVKSGAMRPVMRVNSQITAVREIPAGEALGYGGRFIAKRRTRVGVVAFGYVDGYPRGAPDYTPVAVAGHRLPLIGQVSMDMLTVDITDHPGVGLGSDVELWGGEVLVDEVAARAGTIAEEILCNVKRAAIHYTSVAAR